MYIACNTPNTMQCLDLKTVDNIYCIKLSKYRRLQHLKLQLSQLNEFPKIRLHGGGTNVPNINMLSNQKIIDVTKIEFLELYDLAIKNCVAQLNFH